MNRIPQYHILAIQKDKSIKLAGASHQYLLIKLAVWEKVVPGRLSSGHERPMRAGDSIGLPGWRCVVLSHRPQSFLDLTQEEAPES